MDIIEFIDNLLNNCDGSQVPFIKNNILEKLDKYLKTKYDNDNIINSSKYFANNYLNDYCEKIIKLNNKKLIVESLMKLELPEQRSKEWFEQRKKLLTASSLAAACGKDHFKSKEELILDKISIEKPFISNPITEWGVKYEEIATMFYESLNNLKILEFGMIPHYEFKIFGASPDGICSNNSPDDFIGRMLEIKCPPKRKFTKTIPEHYKMQVLGQLECAGLDECDFLQVKLEEYDNFEHYKKDLFLDVDESIKKGVNNLNLPKGATVTYKLNENSDKWHYLYPSLYLTDIELDNWIKKNNKWVLSKNYVFVEVKYWNIIRYECSIVKRDHEWWANVCPLIIKLWDDVEFYKNNKEELIKIIDSKKKRKKNLNIYDVETCLLE